ncbi:hypothetical protein FRX31_006820 [Thalictrum thalictroides]|uniref:RNase H type-1 domain-containing protein n=1 Tax=Thalictrum thalictroides TaxID=46969 RepID=A0A7J6X5F0_THATH|nr:hypothetical protein FRX31_006820 [Thalictrum thalictroides]
MRRAGQGNTNYRREQNWVNTLLINTDGTLQGSFGGWAAVIRDPNGEVVATTHGKSKYKSIALIELNALEQRLLLSVRHNTTRLKAQTDSTNVVSFMRQGSSKPQ